MPRIPRDPLILELVAAIGAGRIELGPIHDDTEFVHGYAQKNGVVRINPAASVVDDVLHELTHRMRPKWKEHAVRSRVGRIIRQLSDPEIDTIYTLLLSSAKTRRTPIKT